MMRPGLLPALLLALAAPALAQDRAFSIAGEAFSEADIIDARALPSIDGMPTVLISFSATAAARFEQISRANIGKPIAIALNGKILTQPIVTEPIAGASAEINGVGTMQEAIRIAKLISGKEPLRDELEE